MDKKTHWKALHNPDYLGVYALTPGQDLIATIKTVKEEIVIGANGKKEDCMVMYFAENSLKPMIVNATNCKMITKLLKTPYVEEWSGCKIQIYADLNIKFGSEIVEGLRIRAFLPKIVGNDIKCTDCGELIKAFGNMNAQQMAAYTQKNYGKPLCDKCATRAAENNKKVEDVL